MEGKRSYAGRKRERRRVERKYFDGSMTDAMFDPTQSTFASLSWWLPQVPFNRLSSISTGVEINRRIANVIRVKSVWLSVLFKPHVLAFTGFGRPTGYNDQGVLQPIHWPISCVMVPTLFRWAVVMNVTPGPYEVLEPGAIWGEVPGSVGTYGNLNQARLISQASAYRILREGYEYISPGSHFDIGFKHKLIRFKLDHDIIYEGNSATWATNHLYFVCCAVSGIQQYVSASIPVTVLKPSAVVNYRLTYYNK